MAMIFVAPQRIPDEPSCTTSYQRLVEPKTKPRAEAQGLARVVCGYDNCNIDIDYAVGRHAGIGTSPTEDVERGS